MQQFFTLAQMALCTAGGMPSRIRDAGERIQITIVIFIPQHAPCPFSSHSLTLVGWHNVASHTSACK